MERYFICLANSYKRGGRCIAGVEIVIDECRHWTVVRNPNGTPHWIRPIDDKTEFGEIPEFEAAPIRLLSVVRLTDVTPCFCKAHSEDVSFSQMEVVGSIFSSKAALDRMTDLFHRELFYNRERTISLDTYSHGDYSLMLVRPDNIEFRFDPTKTKAKFRMLITYRDTIYDFPVTDPEYIHQLEASLNNLTPLKEAYLCLSLSMEYEGQHHKLVAGVIIPLSDEVSSPFIVRSKDSTKWKVIDIRPFTWKERLSISSAIYIPTYQGAAVYLRKWNRKGVFIPLEGAPEMEPRSKMSLRKVLLVTYKDDNETVIQRIRLKP